MDPIIWAALITAVAKIIATLIKTRRSAGAATSAEPASAASPSAPSSGSDDPPQDPAAPARAETAAQGERRRIRWAVRVYVFVVAAVTVGTLAYLYRDTTIDLSGGLPAIMSVWTEPIVWHPAPERVLLFWFTLTLGFSLFTGALPKGGATTTVASVPDLAALLMFGPATAAVLVGLTDLISNVADRRKGFLKTFFNFFQIMLTVAVTGIVYELCGGRFGKQIRLDGLWPGLPLLVAPVLYFALNTLLVANAIRLGERIALSQVWRRNFQWQVPHVFLLLLPFGTLLAFCQLHFGIPGALLCSLTVILAHFSYQGWLQNRSTRFETARMIVSEIDRSDPSTVNHSNRIAAYAVKVAWELGVSKQEADDIEFAALFHNLGTIAMKHVFLMKRGDLTGEETHAMRRHPDVAYRLVRRVPLLRGAAEIIYSHQETPDGKGYPHGLTDEEIPLGSRILLAVDAFDAMVNGRAHKARWTPAAACQELQSNVPGQFSGPVVEALVRLHETGRLDEELDENFRSEQARHRYGFQVVRYRLRQNVRRALFFLRKALLALFGGNGSAELPQESPTDGFEEPPRRRASAPSPSREHPKGGEPSRRPSPRSEWDNGS